MNSKLTAKLAARYYGCEVVCVSTGFHYVLDADILSAIENGVEYMLLLTPLPAITDEHAIEVAKIIRPEWPIELCADGMWKESFVEMVLSDIAKLHPSRAKAMWDYLRSLGYDCDNAISEGWAVDKTTM